jgi:hypothetical protein
MEIDSQKIREALRRIIEVERDHIFGAKTGSQTARRRDLERELDRVLTELTNIDNAQR